MAQPPPNVVIIMTDDQGYGDLGCHGNPVAVTPQLDRLHSESIRFSDFHVAPMCTPTRGQLLTGLDAARNGAVNVSSGRSLMRTDVPTLADLFQDAGYGTGLFGKWHLGDNYPFRPQDRGFAESLWFPSSHISSLPDYWENDYFDDVYCHNGERKDYTGYCTEVFFREAKAWIGEHAEAGKPFFAFLPTNAPHFPWWVPKEDRDAIEEQFAKHADFLPTMNAHERDNLLRFLAMIRNVDTEIGNLRDYLADLGVAENTLVIFMTDNGSTFGPQYFNAGMRGAKATLWEGGHRVPCFIHWPDGALGEPRDINGLSQVQDILPTLSELCGLTPAPDMELDGVSLAPAMRDCAPLPDRMLPINYSRMPFDTDYPTPDNRAVMRREGSAILWRRWRLLEGKELYDLATDPAQERNVIAEHPDVAAKLTAELDRWWADVEPVANQVQRIIIGSAEENPMMLSACEWRDVFVDQQRQARVAERKNGYWHVAIEEAGAYTFELRRWPRESGLKLREGCPPTQLTDGEFQAGIALPIHRARLMIQGVQYRQPVTPEDDCATFTIDLQPGTALLHTWFDDERDQPICGAYYVYLRRQ